MSAIQKRVTLEKWIAEAMVDSDHDAPISMMACVYMQGHNQQQEVHHIKFTAQKKWTAKELSDVFNGKAHAFCQDLQGFHMFCLLAFYGSNEAEARHPFRITTEAEFTGATEPPTVEGQRAQGMRWGENVLSQAYRKQTHLDQATLSLIHEQREWISELVRENREAYAITKEVLMQKALDDHNRKKEILEFERSSQERKQMLKFLPALANTILGREIFPQSTADTALVETIAEHLEEKDVMQLASVLPPQLMGPLASRLEKIMNERKEEKEAAAEAEGRATLLAMRNPEADAAGDPYDDNATANGGVKVQ